MRKKSEIIPKSKRREAWDRGVNLDLIHKGMEREPKVQNDLTYQEFIKVEIEQPPATYLKQ